MTRLLVHVEGETEDTFVRELLAPHLRMAGFEQVEPRILGNARARNRRGGIRSWPNVADDIVRRLQGDPGQYATTLVDYYALPAGGPEGWPNRDTAPALPHPERATAVELGMERDINASFSDSSRPRRFIGGVLLHEFEALLFSDCSAFADGIGLARIADPMARIRAQFASPEEIDDSPMTAPSKRIIGLIPNYQKPLMGNVGALHIGLEAMRRECPHFHDWLIRLEALASTLRPGT